MQLCFSEDSSLKLRLIRRSLDQLIYDGRRHVACALFDISRVNIPYFQLELSVVFIGKIKPQRCLVSQPAGFGLSYDDAAYRSELILRLFLQSKFLQNTAPRKQCYECN